MSHHSIFSVFFSNYDKRQGKAKRKPAQGEKRQSREELKINQNIKHDRCEVVRPMISEK